MYRDGNYKVIPRRRKNETNHKEGNKSFAYISDVGEYVSDDRIGRR